MNNYPHSIMLSLFLVLLSMTSLRLSAMEYRERDTDSQSGENKNRLERDAQLKRDPNSISKTTESITLDDNTLIKEEDMASENKDMAWGPWKINPIRQFLLQNDSLRQLEHQSDSPTRAPDQFLSRNIEEKKYYLDRKESAGEYDIRLAKERKEEERAVEKSQRTLILLDKFSTQDEAAEIGIDNSLLFLYLETLPEESEERNKIFNTILSNLWGDTSIEFIPQEEHDYLQQELRRIEAKFDAYRQHGDLR